MTDFSQTLINWYRANKRNLPWRKTKDPYKIWLSEIILQQTQVVQGLSYYYKFTEKYPTINDLAKAPADEVMKLWQGLGYYSRARNLHESAKFIVKEKKGAFPKTFESIKELKGVGDYTAAAIASISYGLPYAVVDGNVYRVLSRIFNINTPIDSGMGKKYFQELATELLPVKNPAEYNQAIMEFGARWCKPVNPECQNCVFVSKCQAYAHEKVGELPVKSKKTKIKSRHLHYFIFTHKNHTFLQKRLGKDIWRGLYEFFLIEKNKRENLKSILKSKELKSFDLLKIESISGEYKHILSHQHLYAVFYHVELKKSFKDPVLKKVKLTELKSYPLPRLLEKHLKEFDFMK